MVSLQWAGILLLTSKHSVQTTALGCWRFLACLAGKGAKGIGSCIAGAGTTLPSLCCSSLHTKGGQKLRLDPRSTYHALVLTL